MKYHLDTIPVWDAYHEDCECPLCILEKKAEESYVDSFLGGSVMEPDTRIAVNDKGFCPHHNKLLYKAQNRLGLALLTHTYSIETIKKIKKRMSRLDKSATGSISARSLIKKLTLKQQGSDSTSAGFTDWLRNQVKQCIICDRIDYSLNRYAYTIVYLWQHEAEFKKALVSSKGFCLQHLALVMDTASESLKGRTLSDFISDVFTLQSENLDRLEQELKWFTLKFDYRNQDKPWGNSKDALPRTIQKLTGKCVE